MRRKGLITNMKLIVLSVGAIDTNCYILRTEQGNGVLIDPGADSDRILQTLRDNDIALKLILLTHGHFDHIGALREVYHATDAKLVVSAQDAELLTDPVKNVGARFTADTDRYQLSDIPIARQVVHGDTITLDELSFTVFATPGHTIGSVVYILGDVLFTGDTLFQGSIGIVTHYGGDLNTELASVRRFADELTGDYTIYPGHGPSTTLELERGTNPYLGKANYDDCF